MRSVRRTLSPLGQATLGSLAASLAGQGGTAISGVLVARMLGVENRGYLALLLLWPTILAKLAGLGLPVALPYFIARAPEHASQITGLVRRSAIVQGIGVVAAEIAVLFILLPGKPAAVVLAGLLSVATAPVGLALDYSLGILQGQQRYRAFNILRAGPASLYAISAVGLFVITVHSLWAVLLAYLLASIFTLAMTVITIRQSLRPGPETSADGGGPKLIQLFSFGLRALVGSVSPIETFRLDQAIIGLFLSPAALGLYVVAVAFTNLPRFIAQSLGMVAYPYIASKRHGEWKTVWPFLIFTTATSAAVVAALMISAAQLVPAIFGSGFSGAAVLTRILLLGALFFAIRRILTDASRGLGLPAAGSIAEIASWVWLAVAAAVLVPHLGVNGVALSLTTSAAFSLVVLCVALVAENRSSRPRDLVPITDGSVAVSS